MELNVIVEDKIPFVKGALEPYARVSYLPSSSINAEAISRADALFTRTRTRCDSSLLEGSRCQFIATATIGTDHIDLPWCRDHGIYVANAPGSNAPAVAQWVLASSLRLTDRQLSELTIGIVGVGHVGSIVDRWARQLGYRTLLCDPPRACVEGSEAFCDLSTIAREADIITVHTPLTTAGEDPTWHLIDHRLLDSLARRPIVMNAARGPVVDTDALIHAIDEQKVSAVAIDCWEDEPDLSLELLSRAAIATPHVAGYSLQGKVRATAMALGAFSKHFNLPPIAPVGAIPTSPSDTVSAASILDSYNPLIDTAQLKSEPAAFESLRNNYALRREP